MVVTTKTDKQEIILYSTQTFEDLPPATGLSKGTSSLVEFKSSCLGDLRYMLQQWQTLTNQKLEPTVTASVANTLPNTSYHWRIKRKKENNQQTRDVKILDVKFHLTPKYYKDWLEPSSQKHFSFLILIFTWAIIFRGNTYVSLKLSLGLNALPRQTTIRNEDPNWKFNH